MDTSHARKGKLAVTQLGDSQVATKLGHLSDAGGQLSLPSAIGLAQCMHTVAGMAASEDPRLTPDLEGIRARRKAISDVNQLQCLFWLFVPNL